MIDEIIREHIPQRFNNEQVWVVRASGGRYVDHFRKANLVAIGHVNGLTEILSPNQIALADIKRYIGRVRDNGKALSKATISNLAHQVNTFITEIKPNDLILTIDDVSVAIGRAEGNAYFDSQSVELTRLNKTFKMAYQLRRNVRWGPSFKRSELPYSMELSLRAHQTVFNIDRHWVNLYHCIFPIFRDNKHVYFSTNIKQKKDIDSHSISQLFAVFSDIEALTKTFDPNTNETLFQVLKRFSEQHEYELSCKAEFMSPGHVWAKLGLTKIEGKRLLYFLIAYGCLFGNIKAFEFEVEGIITKEIRSKIVDYVLESMRNRQIESVKDRLQLDVPKYNTEPIILEDSSVLVAKANTD